MLELWKVSGYLIEIYLSRLFIVLYSLNEKFIPVKTFKYLGIITDCRLSFNSHINSTIDNADKVFHTFVFNPRTPSNEIINGKIIIYNWFIST